MSFATGTDTEQNNIHIRVWFECKSCQLTFPFRTVAEFLHHKKQSHLIEFQKTLCIVFEERQQDEPITNYSGEDSSSDTKLFAQDDDVELCTGSGMREFFPEIAEPSSLKTVPLPVPVPVLNQILQPPLNLLVSHKDDTEFQTTGAYLLHEKTRQEYELNADFGLFSTCLPSVHTSTVSNPCDLQPDQILSDSASISSDHWSPDFSFADDHDNKIVISVEDDNVEMTNNRNCTFPNPYVALRRLSAKELLASNRSYNLKSTLKQGKMLKFSKSLSIHRALKTHTKAVPAEQINILAKHDPPPRLPSHLRPKRERKCHICLRPFTKLYYLKNHLVTHKNKEERKQEASFVCEICGKAYIFKHELLRHVVAHGEDRPWKCSYPNCTATFKLNNSLKDHLKTHLPKPQNVPKLFCCPKEGCSKRFTTKKSLYDHLKKTILHTGIPVSKSWKCDQGNCDKSYVQKAAWNRHRIAVHGVGGELPTFQCQICSKTFTWKFSLSSHLQSHTEARPFKCSYDGCEKAFKQIKLLDEHIRGKHTGERPFQCELCGKAYYRILAFQWHMRVHRKSQADTN